MKRKKSIFNTILSGVFITTFMVSLGIGTYVFYTVKDLSTPQIEKLIEQKHTRIYDSSSRLIETLGEDKAKLVKYEELPQTLINALISIEDEHFFEHHGINYSRILYSAFNNLFSSNARQGGSTITQQLVKNLLLTSEISLSRKIQEAYLAYQIEQMMSKEEILEQYFNRIYFDATIQGVGYASYRFFNKSVDLLTLPECAILAGVVKSPSLYSPFKHIEECNDRKNLVLKAMLNNHYITDEQYQLGVKKHAKDLVIEKGSNYQEETYEFQSYLDVVYREVKELTGFNPFSVALDIETYLDTSVQSYIDGIQSGTNFIFEDENQQAALAVIDSQNQALIGLMGGRNYEGQMLYNRSYEMQRQPASTMKPIFTYALAMEHLHYNELSAVIDEPYTYPNTSITVQNADKQYLGKITLLDALGYSRNTSTLYTLEKVIAKIGVDKAVQYLKDIGIMDEGEFTYPYAIGGMKYGVSPIQLAGAYAMLANNGLYIKPSTIKKITDQETGKIIYSRDLHGKQVISKEAALTMTSALTRMIDQNYYNIALAKPSNVAIAGKTGTNAYDSNVRARYNYPSNADRDVWFAGYSPSHTIAVWTGFDEPKLGEKNYFGYSDSRRLVAKKLFKNVMEKISSKSKSFNYEANLQKVEVVKGLEKFYLPNSFVPSQFISYAYFRKEEIPTEILPNPEFEILDNINVNFLDNSISMSILNELKEDEIYTTFFGNRGYLFKIKTFDEEYEIFVDGYNLEIQELPQEIESIEIYETFKNNHNLHGEPYILTFFL